MRFRSDIKNDMANLHFELKDEIEKRATATGKTEQEVLAADPVLLGKILMLNKVDLILGDEFS